MSNRSIILVAGSDALAHYDAVAARRWATWELLRVVAAAERPVVLVCHDHDRLGRMAMNLCDGLRMTAVSDVASMVIFNTLSGQIEFHPQRFRANTDVPRWSTTAYKGELPVPPFRRFARDAALVNWCAQRREDRDVTCCVLLAPWEPGEDAPHLARIAQTAGLPTVVRECPVTLGPQKPA